MLRRTLYPQLMKKSVVTFKNKRSKKKRKNNKGELNRKNYQKKQR